MKLESLKSFRILNMYERLNRGEIINKKECAKAFGVSEKTVQRDIEDLRIYLAECYETGDGATVEYDSAKKGYCLVKEEKEFLTNEEVLGILKILLESRAYNKEELEALVDKMLMQATAATRGHIKEMILNEKFHYIPPKHGKALLAGIWQLCTFIHERVIIEFDYERQDKKIMHRRVKPLAVMFSDYYFYLIAYFADEDKDYPAIFRVDRIGNITAKGEKFRMPYTQRFDEGEFRKRIQLMYTGPLKTIVFEFSGPSVEAVLDRIPTAEIIGKCGNVYTIKGECYGDGILMWLRTQGDNVKIIKGA